MFDTHIHTKYSSDSQMELSQLLEYIEEKDSGCIVTEHMDLLYPDGRFQLDVENYLREYIPFRNEKFLLGIELGMREDCAKQNKEIADNNKFDYVIGSVHMVENKDIYYEAYYDGKSKKQAFDIYFETILKNLRLHPYIDSLGHIDYISRYAKYEDNEMYYESFSDYFDAIFKFLIENDITIEINTRRLRDSKALLNMLKVYKRYKELGGKYITLGSDAHSIDKINMNFDIVKYILEECKLKPVYYKKRKRIKCGCI